MRDCVRWKLHNTPYRFYFIKVRPNAERHISSLGVWMGVGRRWDVSAAAAVAVAVVATVALGLGASARGKHTLLNEFSSYIMNSVLI